YVPSLTGEGKMSKSVGGSYISLASTLSEIRAGTAKIPTDSGRGDKIPQIGGVTSLLEMVELFEGKEKRKEYEHQYLGQSGLVYSEVKNELAESIYKDIEPIQAKRKELENNPEYVEKVIKEGSEMARKIASETLREVKQKMGLV
ncbi:MAG: Tryptophanyl-tRNA synthetase, partial [Candidatus Woesebacteria bacterium GW2011_GWB1_39_10b]